jgi:hypothetical protein
MFNVILKKSMLFCRTLYERKAIPRYNMSLAEDDIHVPRSLWLWKREEGTYDWLLLGHQHLILGVGHLLSTVRNVAYTVTGLDLKHSIVLNL